MSITPLFGDTVRPRHRAKNAVKYYIIFPAVLWDFDDDKSHFESFTS
jgi:hypothetical protein